MQAHDKHYFVFTDNEELLQRKNIDVTFILQKKMGWPFDTMYRFKLFLRIKEVLEEFNYVYYINANAVIVSKVGEEIFPTPFLFIACQHPCYYNKNSEDFIYERNPASSAYIELGHGKHYVMGAFIGGESNAFIQMCIQLNNNIDIDYRKGIIAIWHDESHYNKYLLSNSYKLLSPSYVYPEEMSIPFVPMVILRDKIKYGGHHQLRGIKNETYLSGLSKRIERKIKLLFYTCFF